MRVLGQRPSSSESLTCACESGHVSSCLIRSTDLRAAGMGEKHTNHELNHEVYSLQGLLCINTAEATE